MSNNIIHAEAVLIDNSHEEPIVINADNIDIDRLIKYNDDLKKKIVNLKKEVLKKEICIEKYKIQLKEKKTNHEKEIEKYKKSLESSYLKNNEIILNLKKEIEEHRENYEKLIDLLNHYILKEEKNDVIIVNLKNEISDLKLYINELKFNHEKETTGLNILINDIKNKWADEVYNESI